MTSVRIAPPNKTVANRDLRAAIMRSNSFQYGSGLPKIQPVKMRAKDDSHQIITNHEPILNEGHMYPASSKSVLDALEKNCRKRINNEELILESTKKFCSPSELPQTNSVPPSPPQQLNSKRNREPSSPNANITALEEKHPHLKKLKTRNNALLSSLSSTHYELIPKTTSTSQHHQQKPLKSATSFSSFNSTPTVQTKRFVMEENEIIQEKTQKEVQEQVDGINEALTVKRKLKEDETKKLKLFNRQPDPNGKIIRAKFRMYDTDDEDENPIKFVKPREQVIEVSNDREKLEAAKLNKMLAGLTKGTSTQTLKTDKFIDQVDSNQTTTLTTTTTSSTVTSTSLDTISSTPTLKDIAPSVNAVISDKNEKEKIPQIISVSTPEPLHSILKTSTKNDAEKSDKKEVGGFQFSAGGINTINPPKEHHVSFGNMPLTSSNEKEPPASSVSVAPTATTTISASLGGFQFGAKTEVSSSAPVSTSTLTVSTTSVSLLSTKPVSPLALFSTPAVTPITTASGVGFTFGSKPLVAATTTSTPSMLTTSSSFGIAPLTSTVTPSIGGFSFSSTLPKPVDTKDTKITSSFSFGATPSEPTKTSIPTFGNLSNVTTTTSVQKNESIIPSFTFGNNNVATVKPTQSFGGINPISNSVQQEPSKPLFNFGGNTTNLSTNTFGSSQPPPPAYESTQNSQIQSSFGKPSFPAAAPSASPFSFNANQTPVTTSSGSSFFNTQQPVTSTSTNVFGSSSVTTSSVSVFGSAISNPPSTNVFGASTPAAETQKPSTFTFGGGSNSSSTAQSVFGGSQSLNTAAVKPTFSFGSNNNTSAPISNENSLKPSFNFSNNVIAPQPTFGSSSLSAPTFGPNNNDQKPSFNFTNPQSTSFTFGTQQSTPSPFGQVQNENKPSFNFGSMQPQATTLPPTPSPGGGLFNIGTAGQQQRKPFRTGTRRMK